MSLVADLRRVIVGWVRDDAARAVCRAGFLSGHETVSAANEFYWEPTWEPMPVGGGRRQATSGQSLGS